MIDEIGSLQSDQSGKMEGSDWVYLGLERIEILFIITDGRTVHPSLGEYVSYPKGKRGRDFVINPNYTRKPRDRHIIETSECVRWSLRCYKMLSSMDDTMRN